MYNQILPCTSNNNIMFTFFNGLTQLFQKFLPVHQKHPHHHTEMEQPVR